jgi:hypothetical protein
MGARKKRDIKGGEDQRSGSASLKRQQHKQDNQCSRSGDAQGVGDTAQSCGAHRQRTGLVPQTRCIRLHEQTGIASVSQAMLARSALIA